MIDEAKILALKPEPRECGRDGCSNLVEPRLASSAGDWAQPEFCSAQCRRVEASRQRQAARQQPGAMGSIIDMWPTARPRNGVCKKCNGPSLPTMLKNGRWVGPGTLCAACAAEVEKRLIAAEEADRRERLWKASGLPLGRSGPALDTLDQRYIDRQGRGVELARRWPFPGEWRAPYFWSLDSGLGKSHLAACLVRKFIEDQHRPALFVVVPDLLAMERKGFAAREGAEVIDRACSVPFLALDDLGTQNNTEWALDALFRIIEARIKRRLPTCVTGKYSPSELTKAFRVHGRDHLIVHADSAADRMVELCIPCRLGDGEGRGVSIRLEMAEERQGRWMKW